MVRIAQESSKTINLLKTVLAVGVMMIHIRLSEIVIGGENILLNGNFDTFNTFYKCIMTFLRVCVPVYFMISGFLFFMKMPDNPNFTFFSEGYKKRVWSLLIPYLIGNIFAIISFVIGEMFFPSIMGGGHLNISDYSFTEIIRSFWCMPGNLEPINQVLWFIRDLMVMVVFTPVFYILIKRTNYWCLLIFLLNYIFEATRGIPGFRPSAILFFGLGAYFAIKGKDLIKVFNNYAYYFSFAYILFFSLACVLNLNYLKNISVVAGAPVIITCALYGIQKFSWNIDKKWIAATFFIYIYHNFPVTVIKKELIALLHPDSSIDGFIIYFSTAIIAIIFMFSLYFLLRKIFPHTMAIIVGGK